MESDNEKLLRLVGTLPIDLQVLRPIVQELRDQVDKCQNDETCDGTVEPSVWNMAHATATNLEHVTMAIVWAGKLLTKGGA